MNERELKLVMEILELMAKAEAKVARFYRVCASRSKEDADYWLDLASEEDGHAGMVMRMLTLVTAHPELYTVNRRPDPEYYRSFISWIESNIGEVSNDTAGTETIARAARDIENAVYESKFQDLLSTSDPEYKALISEIADQTRRHSAMVTAKAGGMIK